MLKIPRLVVLYAYLFSLPLMADDTDIYYSSHGRELRSLMMIAVDIHPDMGTIHCPDVYLDGCRSELTDAVYLNLDLMTHNDPGDISDIGFGPDGIPDAAYYVTDTESVQDREISALRAAWRAAAHLAGSYMDAKVRLFDVLRATYQYLLAKPEIQASGVWLGLMVAYKGSECSGSDRMDCSAGGFPQKHFFAIGSPNELSDFHRRLAQIPVPGYTPHSAGGGWDGSGYPLEELYLELYRYVTGDPGNAHIGPAREYVSPFEHGDLQEWACSRLYLVNTVFDSAHSGEVTRLLHLIQQLQEADLAGFEDPDNPASKLVGIDVDGHQNLSSFFLSDSADSKLDRWAVAGGTRRTLVLDSGPAVRAALEETLSRVARESSTLVSAAVPVNVVQRAELFDNVFLAVFRPEAGARWNGNIKKLKLAAGTGESPVLVDAQNPAQVAIDPADGHIKHSVLTYWTDPRGKDVAPENCVNGNAPLTQGEKCGLDGRSVRRGGAAQKIAGYHSEDGDCHGIGPGLANSPDSCARELYTENPDKPLVLIDFNADVPTAALLAEDFNASNPDVGKSELLISWARGAIELNHALREVPGARQRWLMGDVLHSRPLPVNYGSPAVEDTPGLSVDRDPSDIRLFFGANDGWFRMIRNTRRDGTESGQEVWGFMPREAMSIQEDLAADVLPGSGHPYGVDGQATAFIVDRDSDGYIENGVNDGELTGEGDKVFVYFGLRRGGSAYYGLDVSNPDEKPKLMWKISNTGNFSELGLTFSAPSTAIVNFSGTPVPVVIFAGGYNGGRTAGDGVPLGKDIADSPAEDSAGNAIFVVNAHTGDLIWKTVARSSGFAQEYIQPLMRHSIPSDIALLDSDLNGIIDMGYVGDTGGNVWRIDLPESSGSDMRGQWKTTLLGAFGYDGSNLDSDRRFFHPPDVVLARDEIIQQEEVVEREYIGLIIGSGNRARPNGLTVDNYVYFIKDSLTRSGLGVDRSDKIFHGGEKGGLEDVTKRCVASEQCSAPDLELGWQLRLQGKGEKNLSTPATMQGIVYFTSYVPESGGSETCGTGPGKGRLYAIRLGDGESVYPVIFGQNESGDTSKDERFLQLVTPGIPGGLVPIARDGELLLLLPDGSLREISGRFRWRAYWSERGIDEL